MTASAFTPLTRVLIVAYVLALVGVFVVAPMNASWMPIAMTVFAAVGAAYALVVIANVGGAADRLAAAPAPFGRKPPGFDKPWVVRVFHVAFLGVAAMFVVLAARGEL